MNRIPWPALNRNRNLPIFMVLMILFGFSGFPLRADEQNQMTVAVPSDASSPIHFEITVPKKARVGETVSIQVSAHNSNASLNESATCKLKLTITSSLKGTTEYDLSEMEVGKTVKEISFDSPGVYLLKVFDAAYPTDKTRTRTSAITVKL